MASTTLSVQLPSHSYSFTLTIPSSATVGEIKQRIFETCQGSPRPQGQRIIWKGRQLQDSQVASDIWNGELSCTAYLAVHPSAWTAAPPQPAVVPPSPTPTSPTETLLSPNHAAIPPRFTLESHLSSPPLNAASMPFALAYIHYLHINALRILARMPPIDWPGPGDIATTRAYARATVESSGRAWAAILDTPYPAMGAEHEGVTYNIEVVDNLPYLVAQTPERTPTAAQKHAAQVLGFTFPLLNAAPLVQAQFWQQTANATAQQGQLPLRPLAGRLGAVGAVAMPAMPQIQLRALLAPILLLAFRASILLYFFSPARRPVFAMLIAVWGVWELYGAIRAAINVADPVARAGGAAAQGQANVRQPAPGQPANAVPGAGAVIAPPRPGQVGAQENVIARLANVHLAEEATVIVPSNSPVPRPSLLHRVKVFVTLFVLTMHPAVWDRRRRALRARESAVRAIYPTTPDVQQGQIAPEPPAGWGAEYVERVRTAEWADD